MSDETPIAPHPLQVFDAIPPAWISPDRRFCIEQAARLDGISGVYELIDAARKIETYLTAG